MTFEAGEKPSTQPLGEVTAKVSRRVGDRPGNGSAARRGTAAVVGDASIASGAPGRAALRRSRRRLRGFAASMAAATMHNSGRDLRGLIARIDRLIARAGQRDPPPSARFSGWRRPIADCTFWWSRPASRKIRPPATASVSRVKIRVLSISKREVLRDFEGAVEFDQSELVSQGIRRRVRHAGRPTLWCAC